MKTETHLLRNTARLAGLLYFIAAVLSYFGLMYSPLDSNVKNDNVTTVSNILGNEFLFRLKIASNLTSAIIFLVLVFVLYRLFKDVKQQNAKLMVAFIVVQVPITFFLEAFRIAALVTLKSDLMPSFDQAQANMIAMSYLKIYQSGVGIQEIFWGLWLIPFGQLVYRSGFIPRIIGVFLILGAIAYLVDSAAFLLYPDQKAKVTKFAVIFWALAEFPTILWLVIKGVKGPKTQKIQH